MEPRIQEELDHIDQLNKERYLTRSELITKINFPENSPNLVVIQSNGEGMGFLKGEGVYDSRYLAGILTKDKFDTVLTEASQLMGKVYSKKRKMDSQGIPLWYKLTLLLAMIIAIPFLIMAYYLPENDLWYKVFTFVLLGISLTLVCTISLINFFKTMDESAYEDPGGNLNRMIQEKVGAYFKNLNETEYKEKGMEWYLVPGHYWLELRIHRRRNNFVDEADHNQIVTHPQETEHNLNKTPKKREEFKTEEPIGRNSSDIQNLDNLPDN
ncbi:unnamed protein product [Moneuplotes crassus]|uniref:Uncharacterized protein n=1 Tax=Euplotes crassus TaxID=5936 RepID=A0AAD1XPW5_EUPCR|nr:unnamed protein product [Moneuplotes crassus]